MTTKHVTPFWPLVAYFGGSFMLHLVWEIGQMPLYRSTSESFWQDFRMCLFATATGDMLFMLTLYLTVAVMHKKLAWLSDESSFAHPATWLIPVLVGLLLATSFELWAVYAARRWEYDTMPLVPILKVGITPLLQMIVIPVAITAVCRRIYTIR
jgi:hypothetical protein